jgi:hypothetical protein
MGDRGKVTADKDIWSSSSSSNVAATDDALSSSSDLTRSSREAPALLPLMRFDVRFHEPPDTRCVLFR